MHVIHALDHGAMLAPDRDAVVHGAQRRTYRQVVEVTWRVADALEQHRVAPGARAAILSTNHLDAYLTWLGVLRSRVTLLPLNVRHPAQHNIELCRRFEVEVLFIHHAQADAVLTAAHSLPRLRHIVVLGDTAPDGQHPGPAMPLERWLPSTPGPRRDLVSDDDAPVVLNLTSGTTGEPKAVVQTERAMEACLASTLTVFRYDAPPVYLAAAPITHAAGTLSYAHLAQAGTVVLVEDATPSTLLQAIETEQVTTLFLPPTAIYGLLASPELDATDTSSLQLLLSAGAPLAPEKLREAIGRLGPIVGQFYMMTEAPGMLAYMHPRDYVDVEDRPIPERLASCGRPTAMGETAIVGDDGELLGPGQRGEIVVRGTYVMRGYLGDERDSDPVRARGWHRTGDVGVFDDDGFLTIVDRTRDIIISGGFNVFPTEVERVVLQHPEVEDCAVVGVPDDHWGEAVTAVVQPKPGCDPDPEQLRRFCRERLGGLQAPKHIELVEELPRSAVGKVLRRAVRESYWQTSDRRV